MLLVAKEQFLLFHQAEGIWAGYAPHLEHKSSEILTTRFPFSSNLF